MESRTERRSSHISDLPENILKHVFGKLPLWSQWQLRAVCKEWKTLLSSNDIARNRSKEAWIIVSAADQLFWYNVNQGRWVNKGMAFQNARLTCVFEELLFFHDAESVPPCLTSWNAVTGESKVEEILLPSFDAVDRSFGAYVDKITGEMKLLVYLCPGGSSAKLLSRNYEKGQWKECSSASSMCSPNFNNLYANRVVPFLDGFQGMVHLYDVDCDSLTTLETSMELEETKVLYKYHWNASDTGGQFHFQTRGSYVVGPSIPELVDGVDCLGVFRFDERQAKWELVGQTPPGLVTSLMDESESELFLFCSDGEENIWALHQNCSRMLQYNVASDTWVTLPSILNHITSDDGDYEDEKLHAVYTMI